MLTGPADQTAAAPDGYSHGRMRTSRADREQAIDALKVAYVQGRLTKDEFDERLGRALAPLTHAELAALTGDLPDGLATAGRPRGAADAARPTRPSRDSTQTTAFRYRMSAREPSHLRTFPPRRSPERPSLSCWPRGPLCAKKSRCGTGYR